MDLYITLRTVEGLSFTETQRAIVHGAIVEVAEHWGYEVHAVDVLADYAHLLIRHGKKNATMVQTGMKAWSTKHLRENATIAQDQAVWEKGGKVVTVNDAAEFERIRIFIEANE